MEVIANDLQQNSISQKPQLNLVKRCSFNMNE